MVSSLTYYNILYKQFFCMHQFLDRFDSALQVSITILHQVFISAYLAHPTLHSLLSDIYIYIYIHSIYLHNIFHQSSMKLVNIGCCKLCPLFCLLQTKMFPTMKEMLQCSLSSLKHCTSLL